MDPSLCIWAPVFFSYRLVGIFNYTRSLLSRVRWKRRHTCRLCCQVRLYTSRMRVLNTCFYFIPHIGPRVG